MGYSYVNKEYNLGGNAFPGGRERRFSLHPGEGMFLLLGAKGLRDAACRSGSCKRAAFCFRLLPDGAGRSDSRRIKAGRRMPGIGPARHRSTSLTGSHHADARCRTQLFAFTDMSASQRFHVRLFIRLPSDSQIPACPDAFSSVGLHVVRSFGLVADKTPFRLCPPCSCLRCTYSVGARNARTRLSG